MADNKPLTYRVFSDLTSAVKGMADRISLGRPKTIADSVNSIISVELPNTLQPRFAGSPEMSIETFGYFNIYVRAKTDGTMNVGTQTAIVRYWELDEVVLNDSTSASLCSNATLGGENG